MQKRTREEINDPFVERLTDVLIKQRLEELHLQFRNQRLKDASLQYVDLREPGEFRAAITLPPPATVHSKFQDLPYTFLGHLNAMVIGAFATMLRDSPEPMFAAAIVWAAACAPEIYVEQQSRTSIAESLHNQPHLQAKISALTYYTPSKWLLEQEMLSRTPKCEGHAPAADARGGWPANEMDVYDYAAKESLIGLCFSGGGVRSATFNLGILQALAELDLLKHFDYLSTVSGGGYIHQWFAAWIKRSSDLEHVRKQLISQPQDNCMPASAEPIRWLRRYASYLTPNRGLFSADLWVVVAIWFRNTLLNQIVLFTIVGMLFALPHLLVGGFNFDDTAAPPAWSYVAPAHPAWYATPLHLLLDQFGRFSLDTYLRAGNVLACLIVVWVSMRIGMNFHKMRQEPTTEDDPHGLMTEADVRRQLVLPLLLASVWLAYWLQSVPGKQNTRFTWIVIAILFSVLNTWHAFAGGFISSLKCRTPAWGQPWQFLWRRFVPGTLIFLAACVSGIAATATVPLIHGGAFWLSMHAVLLPAQIGEVLKTISSWRLNFVLLPPLYLSAPYFGIILMGGFIGADYPEACREWLARFRAWNMLYGGLWVLLTGSALLGPYVGSWLLHKTPRTAIIGFIVAHVTTLVSGSSSQSDGKRAPFRFLGMKPMDVLAWIASPVAILGLLIAFSSAIEKIGIYLQRELNWLPFPPFICATAAIVLACLAVQATLGMRIDVNTFSMHAFYRNRLSRCYLGATNPDRRPDPFTGFDNNGELAGPVTPEKKERHATAKDNRKALYIRNLLPRNWRPLDTLDQTDRENRKPYDGPFPIFCSTINLTFGEELAWQERKGASFAFTPLYSGYHVGWTAARSRENLSFNGYTATDHYTGDRGIALDTAAAISGAAMNPNQGYNTMPAVAFLMTLFNVRLGWWIWNPRSKMSERTWPIFPLVKITRPSPVCAMSSLMRELLTKVDDTSKFVLLTDGGHFENMGLYELVRRRCKYIVISDAEEDETMQFEGIGRAIRNCRLDFGAEIDLDLRPLQLQKETAVSQMHCVVGSITYPPPNPPLPVASVASGGPTLQHLEDADQYTGIIVYIKSSLTGDEPGDILSYKNTNAAFPQDSTANQRFTESQFESYRRLGHHIGITTFKPAKVGDEGPGFVRDLFSNLLQIWYPPTPELQVHSGENTVQAERLLTELRSEPKLEGLATALFAPCQWPHAVKSWLPQTDARADYALQYANSLIDFMGVVYNNLQLAFLDNQTSPHAKGWIKLFQKWCNTSLVQDAWKKFGDTYPQEFQLFARTVLHIEEPNQQNQQG